MKTAFLFCRSPLQSSTRMFLLTGYHPELHRLTKCSMGTGSSAAPVFWFQARQARGKQVSAPTLRMPPVKKTNAAYSFLLKNHSSKLFGTCDPLALIWKSMLKKVCYCFMPHDQPCTGSKCTS